MKINNFFGIVIVTVLQFISLNINAQSQKILITEFMAINSNGIIDEDGEHSDWIEIYNNSDEDIDLNGWYLSDSPENLKEWQFPSYLLQKGKYLLVYASGKNRIDPYKTLHTNFKLSGSGEFLAISEPDTTISHAYIPMFPAQQQDVSYGFFQGQYVYFSSATPGMENMAGNLPFTPVFSHKRGFYEQPFDVTLTIPGGDGQIYYTINGTRPSKTNGKLYTTPVNISTTTPLSAVVINSANISSPVITTTYIFLNDVINQPKEPAGYPTNWKRADVNEDIPADYEMDSRVTQASAYKEKIIPALKSLPTMNIVTDIGNIFSNVENVNTGGIYIFTGLPHTTSKTWERPASVEYFNPQTGQEFQINCRLKLHGGNSRRPTNSPKHGFELGFKSTYGPTKLNFDIFNEKNSAKEFNSLILRAGYNYTWVKNDVNQQTKGQYIFDPWTKTTQLDMGHPSAHETFVHLYINNLYWGIYNISEELNKDFMESYLGGNEDDYDVVKEKETTTPTDGTMVAWNALKTQLSGVATNLNYQKIQGKNEDGTVNSSYSNLLNVDNYIDYMLLNYFLGNGDWDANNWTVGRNRIKNNAGFNFFVWDAETTMVNLTDNIIVDSKGALTGSAGNPKAFIKDLIKNADFKVTLADRIKKQLIDEGGALTPARNIERYNKLADEIEQAIICESARWSDWYAPYNPYTLNDHWLPRKEYLINTYFPQRTDILLNQLKTAGLYPSINAPVFTHNGGSLVSVINLGMSATSGTIYYTTEGTDPRVTSTGNINSNAKQYSLPVAVTGNLTVKARAKSSTEWSSLTQAVFVFTDPNAVETPLAEMLACVNFPNPFVQSTRIQLNIPYEGNLMLNIYSVDGRLVKQVYNGRINFGEQNFDWQAENEAPGVYICKISFNNNSAYLKLIKN